MKRKEFIRQLEAAGCILLRHGAKHDIYMNPKTGRKQPVPRHREIQDALTKHIKKYLGLVKNEKFGDT
ncbi:MAG: type II toxin-antitoxin system HicA family toxin [Candidatus Jettenia caeni]|nr:MAG: type II toxin-antitoxin system HicA family toxin [Candidatus Jettenia caeni]